MILMALLALGACTAMPEAPLAPAPPPEPFEWHRTGEGTYIYHRVWGDCDTLGHGFGRNMAWGRWEMPLAEVIVQGAQEHEDGGAVVSFTCRDGSACIRQGALDDTPDRVSEHTVPFGTMILARKYTDEVAALKTACAAAE